MTDPFPPASEIHALLRQEQEILQQGKPCAYFWACSTPTIVMGVGGKSDREVHADLCEQAGITVVKRRSGGGTVFLGPGVLCWGVTLPPRDCLCNPPALVKEVLPRLCEGLAYLPVVAQIRGQGDLAVSGRKICGTAQKWTRQGILIHGSLLVDLELEVLERTLKHPPREPDYRAQRPHSDFCTTLSELMGRPVAIEEVTSVLAPELQELTGSPPIRLSPD